MPLAEQLRDVACPIVTPFADGTLDEDSLVSLLAHLRSGGIEGVFATGTTGEFASLSAAERTRVVEIAAERMDGPVIAGAGATSIPETVALVTAAHETGADAAAMVPPYYHTAEAPEGNRQFFEQVADQSPLPLLLYNIPSQTGVRIEPETVRTLATHDRVIGIKDSSGDLEYHRECLESTPPEFVCL